MAFKIAIVDDDEITAKILTAKLSKSGFDVFYFPSGESFIGSLSEGEPDLVLLDIMMPGVSGIGTLKNIRARFSSVELPVIMLSAKDTVSDIIEALQLGANDYITKPAQFDIALARIRTQQDLQKYYKESLKKKELEALNAMIITYNHEINNPLTLAMMSLGRDFKKLNPEKFKQTKKAMDRIVSIVQSISEILNTNPQYIQYAKDQKMIKVRTAG